MNVFTIVYAHWQDDCVPGNSFIILDLIERVWEGLQGTQILLTGWFYIQPESLVKKETSLSINYKQANIFRYLHTRLGEDTNLDAIHNSSGVDILMQIPKEILVM